MHGKTAKEIAEVLVRDVFSVFGSPYTIVSDQEQNFNAQLMKEILDIYQISKTRISTAHPAANGKVEKYIDTLKKHVAMMVDEDQKNWPKFLPLICQAYRSMVHTSTKYSPYEVTFGRPMRTPLDLQRGLPPCLQQNEVNPENYPFWLRQILSQIHEDVREYSKAAAQRIKSNYDMTSTLAPFKQNDQVWFYNRKRIKGKSPKLDTPWEGPYKITKIINDCIAAIQLTSNPSKMRIVNMDKLASYNIPHDPAQVAWLTIQVSP